MNPLRCAVIGVGYLGKFHAQKYAALPDCELVAVVDSNADNAKAIAEQNQTLALTDYREVLGQVDAVSIVTPTTQHFKVARDFLNAGAHVLVKMLLWMSMAKTLMITHAIKMAFIVE